MLGKRPGEPNGKMESESNPKCDDLTGEIGDGGLRRLEVGLDFEESLPPPPPVGMPFPPRSPIPMPPIPPILPPIPPIPLVMMLAEEDTGTGAWFEAASAICTSDPRPLSSSSIFTLEWGIPEIGTIEEIAP